ncbi:MAG: sulfotransferase family protein [Anaerolineales bacterium]|nr:sulfotransferase family protein [Anaerolineales bacterium]
MTEKIARICLWSGPRNISTALMYAFAQRTDTTVFDEPLYAHYLSKTPARAYHPGAEQVIAEMENDGEKVVQNLILANHPTPVVFFKHMTHHLNDLNWDFLDQTVNILLTRDPRDMLPSYGAVIETPTLRDVGYAHHVELLEYLQARGQNPPILDSKQVLLNPRKVLTELCTRIGIPFQDQMLHWQPGPRPEDGSWAKYWYHSVHTSSGFAPYQPKTTPFPPHLEPLLAECLQYYEPLSALALRAEGE